MYAQILDMLRRTGLVMRFYRDSMMPACLVVSLSLAWMVTKWDMLSFVIFGKMAIYPIVIYLVAEMHSKSFLYYRNLGIHRTALLVWGCVTDFILFCIIIKFVLLLGSWGLLPLDIS